MYSLIPKHDCPLKSNIPLVPVSGNTITLANNFTIDSNTRTIKIRPSTDKQTFTVGELYEFIRDQWSEYYHMEVTDIQNAFLVSLHEYLRDRGIDSRFKGILEDNAVRFNGIYAQFAVYCYKDGGPEGFVEIKLIRRTGNIDIGVVEFSYADPNIFQQIYDMIDSAPEALKKIASAS